MVSSDPNVINLLTISIVRGRGIREGIRKGYVLYIFCSLGFDFFNYNISCIPYVYLKKRTNFCENYFLRIQAQTAN